MAEQEAFLTGLFSSIDSLLDEPMDKVLSRLPLSGTVKAALLGEPGRCATCWTPYSLWSAPTGKQPMRC